MTASLNRFLSAVEIWQACSSIHGHQYWGEYFTNNRDEGRSCTPSKLMTDTKLGDREHAEWWICCRVKLPVRWTSTGWRNGPSGISWISALENTEQCTWNRITPCRNTAGAGLYLYKQLQEAESRADSPLLGSCKTASNLGIPSWSQPLTNWSKSRDSH